MHATRLFLALIIGISAFSAQSAQVRSDFPWQAWGPEVFEQARKENRFVLLSLQAWWCEPCHRMNSVTYDDQAVRKILASNFIPVHVDQDSRPDLSQRFERWGWPATVIFAPDGTEIVKLRGFYSPKFFLPILTATIDDPSPVDYGKVGGPERARALHVALPDKRREFLTKFFNIDAYDKEFGGWGNRGKHMDGPTLEYALDRARSGDEEMATRLRGQLDGMLRIIEPATGGLSTGARKNWERPLAEYTMYAQEAGLRGLALGYALFGDERYAKGAQAMFHFMRDTLSAPDGGLYASMGAESFEPGVDKRRYARENGKGIAGLVSYYDATGDAQALSLAARHATWVMANRALPGGGYSHDAEDKGGPYLADTLEMGRAFIHLHRSTGERRWLDAAVGAGDFILANFVEDATGGFMAAAKPAQGFMTKAVKQKDDNVAATRLLNLLNAYTAADRFREAAEAGMGYLASDAVLEAFWYLPGVLQAEFELGEDALHVTVVGGHGNPKAAELYAAALAYPAVHKRAEWWDRSKGDLANPNVKYPQLATAAAFACSGNTCSLPVTDASAVAEAINRLQE